MDKAGAFVILFFYFLPALLCVGIPIWFFAYLAKNRDKLKGNEEKKWKKKILGSAGRK